LWCIEASLNYFCSTKGGQILSSLIIFHHELANHHNIIRQMMGHSDWCDDYEYSLQSIKDNLQLFTPEILEQIKAGHSLVKKSPALD